MSKLLEQRIVALEKEVAELKKVVQPARAKKVKAEEFIEFLKQGIAQITNKAWLNAET
ncbi:hypothetical protein SAMN00808754_1933 [Thermanaeromonas toyohensis ToBE]|uniref:Uncharacterized protein n=1 Tax=Thermanaeromonas toyohensis ToBE TaxID=698762 RepID=A0A1W1VWP5_9FIRM|nr:hypothetical protein [Thermanaeromonas toyohensis]SMB97748.1 hypothetical protein SAMN00808754_1933 [Thermanaeromonas toyohensis ToBE]